jgi:SAM-dependent methyltransferase
MRTLTEDQFTALFGEVVRLGWQEEPEYYRRYRSRYQWVLARYATMAPAAPQDVLEVGGGQLAFLAQGLWSDRAVVADISTTCFPSLTQNGVTCRLWNLARDPYPADDAFDFILFSEVLEHLPVPGHVALAKLRALLRPGGHLILTTPNLYRLRNAVFLVAGRPLFDHFDLPSDSGSGHVLEYSREHLCWQLERAGFTDYSVDLEHFGHVPKRRVDRSLVALGAPLRRVPRYRDNLVARATL